jgi:uncharacterized membrane protein
MDSSTAYEDRPGERLAVGLGWFSVALGIAELAAPRAVARVIGVYPDSKTVSVLRSYGVRELGNGVAILTQPNRASWIWSRVAGDALDVAGLARAMNASDTHQGRAAFATAAILGVTVLDILAAWQLGRTSDGAATQNEYDQVETRARTTHVAEAITINKPMEYVEDQWLNHESMQALRHIQALIQENPGSGFSVRFQPAPGARGTEVRVDLKYPGRAGAVSSAIRRVLSQDPSSQIRYDLQRFKQLLETGEMTISDGPSLKRPAQPSDDLQQLRTLAGVS